MLRDLLGEDAVLADLTELPGVRSLALHPVDISVVPVCKRMAMACTCMHGEPASITGMLRGAVRAWKHMHAGLDNLHEPEGAIAAAQVEASEVFSAAQTHFLVNGSTGGILAVVAACCGPGAVLVASRASHASVFNTAAGAGVCQQFPQAFSSSSFLGSCLSFCLYCTGGC